MSKQRDTRVPQRIRSRVGAKGENDERKEMSFVARSAFGIAMLCLAYTSALAGNSTFVTASGQPIRWPNGGRSIPFSTELGMKTFHGVLLESSARLSI